jgi:hypothetical protein
MADRGPDHDGSPAGQPDPAPEHLNIKVTDNNNEVFFKIKRSTKLEKLMTAFCERQGKSLGSLRFLFDGQRVQPTDTPDTVSFPLVLLFPHLVASRLAPPSALNRTHEPGEARALLCYDLLPLL